jgi:Tfp pilus assembly PilM family ATPase
LGLKNANSDMITGALSSLVDLIAFETKKTIHNYEDLKKTKIARILLVGGLANMPMFMEYFSSKLEMPVSAGNPLARVLYSPALEVIKPEINSTFTVSLGLAMRDV